MSVLTKERVDQLDALIPDHSIDYGSAEWSDHDARHFIDTIRARDAEIERLKVAHETERREREQRGQMLIAAADRERKLLAEVKRKDEALAKAVRLCEEYSADWKAQRSRTVYPDTRDYCDGASRALQEMASKIAALAPQPAPSEQPVSDSPPFVPKELREFEARNYERVNRKPPSFGSTPVDATPPKSCPMHSHYESIWQCTSCLVEDLNTKTAELKAQRAEMERNAERAKLTSDVAYAADSFRRSHQSSSYLDMCIALDRLSDHDARASKAGGK